MEWQEHSNQGSWAVNIRLREKPVPAVALCEGVLPGIEALTGYVKYTNPPLPTFTHGSAALYVAQSIPQRRVNTTCLPSGDYESAAVRMKLGKRSLTNAPVYSQAQPRALCTGVLEGLHTLSRDALLVLGDLNAYHTAWGSSRINKRDREFAAEAERAGLVVANGGSLSFLRAPDTRNVIDVAVHSPNLPVT